LGHPVIQSASPLRDVTGDVSWSEAGRLHGEILTPNSLREMTANNAVRARQKMDVRRAPAPLRSAHVTVCLVAHGQRPVAAAP